MDNAIVNIPLAKRGNIDAQIDAYKRDQAKQAAAARKEAVAKFKAARVEAKRILAAIIATPGLLDAQAAKRGMKRKELLDLVKGVASSRPAHMVVFERDWLAA